MEQGIAATERKALPAPGIRRECWPVCVAVVSLPMLWLLGGGGCQQSAEPANLAGSSPGQPNWPTQNCLRWRPLPDLPDPLGVAGAFVGVHQNALIIAGGANFPEENRWQAAKQYEDRIWVLERLGPGQFRWHGPFRLPYRVAYGASASTPAGLLCMGGEDGQRVFDQVLLLSWEPERQSVGIRRLPPLPEPTAYAGAAVLGQHVYLAGGQSRPELRSASVRFWRLDLSKLDLGKPDLDQPHRSESSVGWEQLPGWPGPARSLAMVAAQHNGFEMCLYLMGGRCAKPGDQAGRGIIPLADVYEFSPQRYQKEHRGAGLGNPGKSEKGVSREEADGGEGAGVEWVSSAGWRRRADMPQAWMAGSAAPLGPSHLAILSGDPGTLWDKVETLRDQHPGFPLQSWLYHTITDTWTAGPKLPTNQLTTPIVSWWDGFVLASGEERPCYPTPRIWLIQPVRTSLQVGHTAAVVLIAYLAGILALGLYFTLKNRSTDDFFRGGQRVAWPLAGLSIFATMLSSITYTGIPAKAYAQDWVYAVGNLMIVAVAPIAIYVAMPFFRRINATSAYEYLERRFHRGARLFGSASFTLFHLCRMGIVMTLAGLALAAMMGWDARWCVVLIGLITVVYCTLGGVTAVIWTDAIQAVVLLGGAAACLASVWLGLPGGLLEGIQTAYAEGKLRVANLHTDLLNPQLGLLAVVLGAMGQNLASYISDQAVVQRYLTTPTQQQAARAIWTNALISIPSTLLFFSLGTGLYLFYRGRPERLDPGCHVDQILPFFVSQELPGWLAGLILAGLLAAAQSTVSSSMNSTAATVLTDFIRPLRLLRSERAYLGLARWLTLLLGLIGVGLGVYFVNPDIRSLWDKFLAVLGLFMGVLGGVFCLGLFSRRANGLGAWAGIVGGLAVVLAVALHTSVQGYIYAAIGIGSCFWIGYLVSLLTPGWPCHSEGLTIFSRKLPNSSLSEQTI
ncbi:MAG: sodium/solute symporter [Thermoguttaceae bacterium]|nr:sodium/solute symporter [Thermoguttaceae bacterium]MDW8037175.1 sodium/solute symporter [Thermoguttaceae bacterium]